MRREACLEDVQSEKLEMQQSYADRLQLIVTSIKQITVKTLRIHRIPN